MSRKSPAVFGMLASVSRMPNKDLIRSYAIGSDDQFMKSDEFWIELARYKVAKNEYFEPTAEDEVRMARLGYPRHGIAESVARSLEP